MNPHVLAIPPSLIRAINARKREGDIDLGLGEPTLKPDLRAFAAAEEWIRRNGCPYSPNAGFEDLRARIAQRYGRGRFETPEEVCVTVGSEEAIYAAIKAVVDSATDEVVVVDPGYLAYGKICGMEGIRVRSVSLDGSRGFAPSADAVLEAVGAGTRMVVLNTPSNPTGRIWSDAELRALAAGLRERDPPVWVLADEVYRELYYTDEPPPSIADHHPHSLLAGSLSKSCALTGLRVGWLIGPRDAVGAAMKVHQFVNTAASTHGQRVAFDLFQRPESLGAHRGWYADARGSLLRAAREVELEILPPEGAFYALLKLPPSLAGDSVRAAESLLEAERVVTVPGAAFGQAGEGWLRLSFVAPPADIREGLSRVARFLSASVFDSG